MAPHDFVEIRLVCKADYLDPQLKAKLQQIREKLREILHTGRRRFALKKVQPWNSVKVTFDIPKEAADRLRLLAVQGNVRLVELGILSVEIVGQSNAIVVTKTASTSSASSSSSSNNATNSINKELPRKTTEEKNDDDQHRAKRMKVEHESNPIGPPPHFPRIPHPSHPPVVAAAAAPMPSNGLVHEMPDSWNNYSDNYKMKVNGLVPRPNNHYYHPAPQPALLLTENPSSSMGNASMFCPPASSTTNPYEMRNTSMPNSFGKSVRLSNEKTSFPSV